MAEQQPLLSASDLFREFVESTDELLTIVDGAGCFQYVNPAAERIFGVAPAECIGLSAWTFVHPEDRERTWSAFEQWTRHAGARTFHFENRQVSRTGDVREMSWTVTRHDDEHGRMKCLTSCARDVTALKAAENVLLRSRNHLEAILAGALDPIITIDPRGVIQHANKSCAEVFGFRREELIGVNIGCLMPEPYRSEHDGYLDRYRRTGKTNLLGETREFPAVRKDGTPITIEVSISRIDVPGRTEALFCGSFRDITARKLLDKALAESEQRFRAIFDQEYQFVGLLDPTGHLLEANRASLTAIGAQREDVIGLPFWETPGWSHSSDAQEQLKRSIELAAAGEFVRFETAHIAVDGEQLAIDFSLKPVRDDSGRVALLLPEGRDITEIKRSQDRESAMMRSLAEIGESASLLAHEIKNPITAVNTALRAVAKQLGEDDKEILSDLVGRMKKLERLMRRTLSLARPLELEPIRCRIDTLLSESLAPLRTELEEAGIHTVVAVARRCPDVRVDPVAMDEVLTNLIRNAIEAMPEGGEVRLEAYSDKNQVVLCVDDAGTGIPASLQDTVFKAYVSSKANGTGLGLAIVRKIVEAHGGTIEARSSPLGGARFEIRLQGLEPAKGA